jgi:hypothetical protein
MQNLNLTFIRVKGSTLVAGSKGQETLDFGVAQISSFIFPFL